jgi:hypothetical protein
LSRCPTNNSAVRFHGGEVERLVGSAMTRADGSPIAGGSQAWGNRVTAHAEARETGWLLHPQFTE